MGRTSRSYRSDPDGGSVLDPDRGSSASPTKLARFTGAGAARERDLDRAGLRDLDTMTEQLPGLTRQQRDRDRILPRPTSAELRHPQMARTLQPAGAVRLPFSGRQKDARSKARRTTADRLPQAQYDAQRQLLTSPARWRQVNDALSDAASDVQALSDRDQLQVRRVDRSIQAYERANVRGHVIYANVEMPAAINHTSLLPFTERNFQPGDQIAFDRYTAGSHQLHEVSVADPAGRIAVFEIQTRRGTYLGGSSSIDSTGHLLPRGLQLEVTGVHRVTFRRPDGTTGRRVAIQLVDVTDSEPTDR